MVSTISILVTFTIQYNPRLITHLTILPMSFCIEMSLMKAMATYSSTLAWKIPWTEEPGRLQSMGSLGVGHD